MFDGLWPGAACRSKDGSVEFSLSHNVCGRAVYAEGTVDAAVFVADKAAAVSGHEKRIYSMIDVLQAGAMK